jgi:hypothetical protein
MARDSKRHRAQKIASCSPFKAFIKVLVVRVMDAIHCVYVVLQTLIVRSNFHDLVKVKHFACDGRLAGIWSPEISSRPPLIAWGVLWQVCACSEKLHLLA